MEIAAHKNAISSPNQEITPPSKEIEHPQREMLTKHLVTGAHSLKTNGVPYGSPSVRSISASEHSLLGLASTRDCTLAHANLGDGPC